MADERKPNEAAGLPPSQMETVASPGPTQAPGPHAEPAPAAPRPHRGIALGSMLGKYKIRSVLGRGGMGSVYGATDPLIKRDVAIKILPPELAADPPTLKR